MEIKRYFSHIIYIKLNPHTVVLQLYGSVTVYIQSTLIVDIYTVIISSWKKYDKIQEKGKAFKEKKHKNCMMFCQSFIYVSLLYWRMLKTLTCSSLWFSSSNTRSQWLLCVLIHFWQLVILYAAFVCYRRI